MSNFKINFSNPWLLLLLIPAIILTLFPYFRIAKKYRRTRNRVVSIVLHTLVMFLCITLLAGITFSYDIPNTSNEILLLVDSSFSNRESKDKKDEFIQSIVNACGSEFKIGFVKFGYNQLYVAELDNDAQKSYEQFLASEDPDTSATDIASALKFASNLFSNPQTAKIVLISDGLETDGTATSVIKAIAATGIKVDTVHFADGEYSEVQIVGADLPAYNLDVGETFKIGLTVQSNYGGDGETASVVIYDNGAASLPIECELAQGTQTLQLEHSFDLPGLHELRFEISSVGDTLSQNNTYYAYVYVQVFNNVLIIEKDQDESAALKALLQDDYNVKVLSIENDLESIPQDLTSLCAYDEVILVNIANSDMPVGFDELLYEYVYNLGGGLFTVGGNNDEVNGTIVPHAYNRDDMYATLYQKMLPVQVIDYTPPIAVMIIIDRSGSMGSGEGSKLGLAKEGALACLDALSTRDYCGIMTLENSYSEDIRVTPVTQKELIRNAIYNIPENGGGTVFSGAIERAGLALAAVDVENRHIILVTDGLPSDKLDQYGEYIDINASKGITMSIVGIQMSSSAVEQMEQAAERGGGECYDVQNVDKIAGIMYNDLVQEAIAEIEYGEEFIPQIKDHTSAVAGIDQADMPPLTGYYGTKLKDGADVPLMGKYVPIYAQWQYGAGRVGSFLSDLTGPGGWSEQFMDSSVGQMFIYNVINGLFPTQEITPTEIEVKFNEDNYTTQMNVYTDIEEGGKIETTIEPLSSEAIEFYSEQSIPITAADGYTRFTFVITCPGLYRVHVVRKNAADEITAELTIYRTFSYSEEYVVLREEEDSGIKLLAALLTDDRDDEETLGVGEQLLADLAKSGKGVVVTDSSEVFNSFIRTLHKTVDPRLLFLILATVFFLLDVAVRKFKFKWPHELVKDYRMKKSFKQGEK